MDINKKTWRQLSITTVIRTVYSTGFRMVFPYQPILMKGLGIELAQMTRLIAGQSLVGIFSPFLASMADTRGRKTGMLTGMIFLPGFIGGRIPTHSSWIFPLPGALPVRKIHF